MFKLQDRKRNYTDNVIEKIRKYMEFQAFGVCSRLADKIEIKASTVRLYFIYLSFITLGSPLIVYLVLMFFLRLKDYIRSRKPSVFDL